MRNIYIKQGLVKLPRPRQFYSGFAVSGHGSWSKSQFLKNRMNDTFRGRIKQRRVK